MTPRKVTSRTPIPITKYEIKKNFIFGKVKLRAASERLYVCGSIADN